MLRSRLLAFPTLALASLAGAQTLSGNVTASFDGPNGLQFNNGSTNFGPLFLDATASYDEDSDEGRRQGSSSVTSATDYGSISTGYTFSVDSARYGYLTGNAQLSAFDNLTLSNTSGATAGRYRVRLDYVRTGNSVSTASVVGGGFSRSNLGASGTFLSDEFDFTYDQAFDASLSLDTSAERLYTAFDTFSFSDGFQVGMSFVVTDTGGAAFADITQASLSGAFYNVQAVPEPASMAALGLGAVGLVRRRAKRVA